MPETPNGRPIAWRWLVAALVLGAAAGALDLVEREVQGPLLVLMVSAFVVALPRRAPTWAVGLAASLGLPLAHAVAAIRGGEPPSWGMLIAVLPTLLAAYAGAFTSRLVETAARGIPRDRRAADAADDRPWIRRPANSSWLLLAAVATSAVVGVVPVYGTLIARAQPVAWWVATWWQVVAFVAWVAFLPAVLAIRRRIGSEEAAITPGQLAVHLGVVLAGAAIYSVLIVALTRVLFVPLGAATFGVAVAWAFTAYLPLDALTYALVLALAHASDRDRRERVAREQADQLSAQLDRARLTALEAQIRPHFLFNALNATVALVRRGPADQAATVLTGLADLLRYVLDDTSQTVRLEDELTFVARYLAIEQVRLGDRLRWRVDASVNARRALVPRLLLQPLAENAVQHGVGKQLRGGEIVITARCENDVLRLTVADDGPGVASPPGEGIGLANTRARIHSLFGNRGALELRARADGGCVAEVALPISIESAARSA